MSVQYCCRCGVAVDTDADPDSLYFLTADEIAALTPVEDACACESCRERIAIQSAG